MTTYTPGAFDLWFDEVMMPAFYFIENIDDQHRAAFIANGTTEQSKIGDAVDTGCWVLGHSKEMFKREWVTMEN